MEEIKSFDELVFNQKVLIKKGKLHRWFGRYKRQNKRLNTYKLFLINSSSGGKIKYDAHNDFFIQKIYNNWKIFKLTDKEFEKCKLKLIVNKL